MGRRDDVKLGEEQIHQAKEVIQQQLSKDMDPDKKAALLAHPASYWDTFYSRHENRFFKDRNWLPIEFPELFQHQEVGALA